MKVIALTGSLREDSFSSRLVEAAAELVPAGVEIVPATGLGELPAYNQDHDVEVSTEAGPPPGVLRLRNGITTADALLIVTPEYNAGPPGFLKNALDWASRPHGASSLAGKPTAIISSSPMPFGGLWANQQLRKSLSITSTPTVERELAIGKVEEKIDADGRLTDQTARNELAAMIADLVELAIRGRARPRTEEEDLVAA